MKISRKLFIALSIVVTGFLFFSFYIFSTLNRLKVNGPVYTQIVAGKDLIADVLPPTDFIIESYLTAFEIRENMENEDEVKRLTDYALNTLLKDYNERHEYWQDDQIFLPLNESLRNKMLKESYEPVVTFYEVFEKEFIPAVTDKDKALADKILNTKLKMAYSKHRTQIDVIVKMAQAMNLEIERNAAILLKKKIIMSAGICILAITLGIILMVSVALSISLPVRRTIVMLKDISEGDGDLTKRLEIKRKDEIGEMAGYFNLTLDKISNLVTAVKKLVTTLSGIGVDLTSTMAETAASITEISANIDSIKNQTENQSASVSETNITMEQVIGLIEDLDTQIKQQSENVTDSSSAIEEMMANIDSVTKMLVKNSDNLQSLTEASNNGRIDLNSIVSDIREVASDSENLLEISSVIANIASQTNLLSMNAAIEAAHAGDSGRGFAVVADEIRKLAESSGTQAKTISTVLKKIKDSVDKISGSATQVVSQFESMENEIRIVAEQEFSIKSAMEEQSAGNKQVLESISELHEITTKVENSSARMQTGSKEVIKQSNNLSRITEEITFSMNEIASGAQQITTAVNRVNDMSKDNQAGIDTLSSEMSRFKVEE